MQSPPIIRSMHAVRNCMLAFAVFGAAVLLGAANVARAVVVSNIVQVNLNSGGDWGAWQFNIPVSGDPYTWQLSTPVDIYSVPNPGLLLGTVTDLSVTLEQDPQVLLGFNVTAGNVPTHFTISSPTVNFSTISNPQSFATAAITVTDSDSSIDGATVTGLFPGTKAYEAQYNITSVFADLVSPVVAGTDDSNIGSERFPAVGSVPIIGSVTSIQSQFDFTLSANDSASGTSRFNVVPEPSSLALLMIAGVLLAWRAKGRGTR